MTDLAFTVPERFMCDALEQAWSLAHMGLVTGCAIFYFLYSKQVRLQQSFGINRMAFGTE